MLIPANWEAVPVNLRFGTIHSYLEMTNKHWIFIEKCSTESVSNNINMMEPTCPYNMDKIMNIITNGVEKRYGTIGKFKSLPVEYN